MVVLAASVLTKPGKVLVSRQFVPMPRIRIEGLLAAFPKLVETGEEGKVQHTFIETDNVRYIYQPIEDLYVVLITNKQSNIKEDLDTLRLAAKLIPEYCNGHDEHSVVKNTFELIFALDELISIGYKEYVTVPQVKTFTDMDSHEEKLQDIIRVSKEQEESAQRKARSVAIAMDKAKVSMAGIGSKSMGSASSHGYSGSSSGNQGQYDSRGRVDTGYDPSGSHDMDRDRGIKTKTGKKTGVAKKGMQIGGKQEDLFQDFDADGFGMGMDAPTLSAVDQSLDSKQYAAVEVLVQEKLKLSMDRDGVVTMFDVRGILKLSINDPDFAMVALKLSGGDPEMPIKFNMTPKVDKVAWKNKVIQARNKKGFPIGRDNALDVLTWRISTDDESFVPITLTAWPSEENGMSVVTAEFAVNNEDLSMSNVVISFPCPSREAPEIREIIGESSFDAGSKTLNWYLDSIPEDGAALLEFAIPEVNANNFFPVQVNFSSDDLFSGIQVDAVGNLASGKQVEFNSTGSLVVEQFTIG